MSRLKEQSSMKIHPWVLLVLVLVLMGLACSPATPPDDTHQEVIDVRLDALKAEMDLANTTQDMNEKSFHIYEHLEHKLIGLEELIRRDLDPETLEIFNQGATQWRAFRQTQADFVYSLYRTGSIRGLMRNSTRIRLTEERLADLQCLSPDSAYLNYTEDGVGGWIE